MSLATSPRRRSSSRSVWLVAVVGPLSLVATACNDTQAAAPVNTLSISVPDTVGLTGLPEPLTLAPTLPPPASFEPLPTSSTSTTELPPPPTVPYTLTSGRVGLAVEGNRILMIGDSILASTAERFGGPMCTTMESYGWAVQIEAEEARHIEFADEVLDELLPEPDGDDSTPTTEPGDDTNDDPADNPADFDPDDFDAVMVMLGNNYRGDIEDFEAQYDALLRRLTPRPVVVFTVTEDEPIKAEVNDVIRGFGNEFDNVLVVDWAEISGDAPDELLGADDLHLSNLGRDRLSLFSVAALGPTNVDDPDCLESVFTDDSGG
ncbi:MAG TPA: SGNH/GDSL hydrolase family protein [Ilumatobacter sp.]|nr:SGNH/GDSL hydrolase family protein [Ilumatobacter sp.]